MKGLRTASVVCVLVTGVLLGFLGTGPEAASALTPRSPILIDGNADFNAANGVVGGSGVPGDPYVIEGWDIDASTANGVEVRNTDASFVLRDTRVRNGLLSGKNGVHLYNVSNGNVENVTSGGNAVGIFLSWVRDSTVLGNSVSEDNMGVRAFNTDTLVIADNVLTGTAFTGIELSTSLNASVTNNSVADSRSHGIQITNSANGTLANNTVTSSLSLGIYLFMSSNLTAADNTVERCSDGIVVWDSADLTLRDNDVSLNARYGMWLSYSERITLARNTMASNGVMLEGHKLEYWNTHDIDATNTVNGWPVHYVKDQADVAVPPTVGQALLANCTNIVAQGLNVPRASAGIQIAYSSGILVAGSNLSDNEFGVYLYQTANQTIAGNTLRSNRVGLYAYRSSNGTMAGNDFSLGEYGIDAVYLANMTIANNTVAGARTGIYADYLTDSNVTGNTLLDNRGCGICVFSASGGNVDGNILRGNYYGIDAAGSRVSIRSNNVTGGYAGILVEQSSDSTIGDNVIAGADHGIYLYASSRLTLSGNTMSSTGIFVRGWMVESWNSHVIDSTNTINGRPVHYLKNQTGGEAPSGAAEVILGNCSWVTVRNQNVSDGTVGVLVGMSHNITVQGNDAAANKVAGVHAEGPDNAILDNVVSGGTYGVFSYGDRSTIVNNTAEGKKDSGIMVRGRDVIVGDNVVASSGIGISLGGPNARVTDNVVWGSGYGMYIYAASGGVFSDNVFSGNSMGLRAQFSSGNYIVHNSFVHNSIQAYDDAATDNDWYAVWPFGGNYWSDYRGVDYFSEEDQNFPGSDGIGDTPYEVDPDTTDRYPLMQPTRPVDIVRPSVSITSPTEGQAFTASPITVTGVAADSGGSGLSHVEVRVNGGAWQAAQGASSWSASVDLVTGGNRIEARSWDNSHNPSALDAVNVSLVPSANTPPSALFDVAPASGDIGTVFGFDASASSDAEDPPGALQVRWDWEDDGTWDTAFTTVKTGAHQYASPGAYRIRMEVMDTGGLVNETTRDVQVDNTAPLASFVVIPLSGNVSTSFLVDASGSTDLEDPAADLEVRWDWDGDGFWDTGWNTVKTASHTYDGLGTYTIGLEVKDTGGLTDQATAQVQLNNTAPEALFAVSPTVGDVTTVFLFDAWISRDLEDGAAPLEVRWDWEDDGAWDTPWSASKTAQHRYVAPGSFTVRLEVRDSGGLTDGVTGQIQVVNYPPAASFLVAPTVGDAATPFVVNASASSDLEDLSAALEVRWDWEDDGTWDTAFGLAKESSHVYPTPGTYTIRMQVRDRGGLVGEVTRSVRVNDPPVAAFGATPPSGDVTTSFTFDASASSDAEDPVAALEVRWDWEDDGLWDTSWSTTKTASHRYGAPGAHTARLEVRDADGSTAQATVQVQVVNTPPAASFTATPTAGYVTTQFVFDARASSDLEDLVSRLEVRWDWENDGTWDTSWSDAKLASHQYPAPGTYTVALEVRDAGLLSDVTTRDILVENRAPTASFTVDPASGGASTTFSVDAASSFDLEDGTAVEVRWDWENDGAWDTDWSATKAAQHHYTASGSHTIRLEVRDAGGLSDTTTRTVHVAAAPEAPPGLPWWVVAMTVLNTALAVLLLAIVLALFFRLRGGRRGKPGVAPEEEESSGEEAETGPPDAEARSSARPAGTGS